ncbi:hypothetical protein FEM21_15980 [Flavobacterium seoulense]|uniref:Uncharacterized protein n=1 Tax=Flavobacterium seoulense TaxID=1492738 RepID=A0A066WWG6_9FLAO|nr:hypothetical protein FEM21_15980 [Flavobacterium seoulense]
MNLKSYAPVFYFLLFAVILYIVHKLIFSFFGADLEIANFHYSLEYLYAFFAAVGVLIVFSLIMVFKTAPDFVGIAFLAATTINLVFSYIIARPILAKTSGNIKIEKINFFVIFILFLLFKIIITAKMLKNSNENGEKPRIN